MRILYPILYPDLKELSWILILMIRFHRLIADCHLEKNSFSLNGLITMNSIGAYRDAKDDFMDCKELYCCWSLIKVIFSYFS